MTDAERLAELARETNEYWEDDDECEQCHGTGDYVWCVDDMCHGLGYCIHTPPRDICPYCHGVGYVYQKGKDHD